MSPAQGAATGPRTSLGDGGGHQPFARIDWASLLRRGFRGINPKTAALKRFPVRIERDEIWVALDPGSQA